mmetsp:Transcript_3030/g.6265  ORF Transcript_3030/g.6265 Transcript_3030/m.6265 type:complete len:1081 (-) Transcript_3030:4020-7262(-)
MSKELQFRFDSITMLGGTSVSPSVVAFDKRTLYLGQNWTIKLKELNRINIDQEEENDDGGNYSSNDRRYNRYNSGGSGQRRHGASHQGTIVTLQGKGKPFTCITTTNNNNDEFHNFLEALKQMHRKVKLKNNEKDPYASAASNNNRRGGGIMRSNSRKPLITPTVSRSNQQQQQQQQSRSSLHMTPQKMKQSTGAFLSRNRTTNNNNHDGAHSNNKTTRGNVLNDNNNNTSPSLNLPPKSPRNATPTKLRRTSEDSDDDDNTNNHDEFEFDDSKDDSKRTKQSSSRVLFHDSVVKRDRKRVKVSKLQRRIEEKMLDDRSDDEDDVEMKQTEEMMMEEEEEEETNVMMKKKRLRKVAVQKDDGEESDGSDLEFDVGTSSTTGGDVRKKLRLEDDDDDDEDEEDVEGENDSPSPAREEKVKKSHASGKTITDEDTSRETSPVTTEDVVAADDDDLEEGEVSSTPEEKPSAKKGPGTLHSFFAPRLALSTSSSKKTAKSSLPSTSPVPPTPTKKKQALHPSTPSSRSSSYTWHSSQTVETTPIAMQKQANRWDIAATTTPKKPANPSPALFRSSLDSGAYYSNTPSKTPAGGYGSDYEQEEEVDDIYGNDTDENTEPPTPPIRTTYHKIQQRNQISSRGRRQVYGQRGALGRARLPVRNPYQNDFRRGGNRISEADSALGRKNLGARTLGRDMSRRKLGKASLFPAVIEDQNDDEEEVDDKPKIPGIQNLGNTCYLSASLQTLYSIPQFLHKLYQSYEELCSFKELPLTTALLEVAVTIGALKEEDVPMISPDTARSTLLSSKAANPSALKKQMDVLTDKFAGYEQRDAHEFLGDLVDFLHEELVDSPSDEKDDDSKKSQESNSEDAEEKPATVVTTDLPTDEYFHLKVRVCLKCKSCGYSRSKEELYRHLSIDVGEDDDGESWGVERSLEHFFQAEDRELNCEKCEDGTSATQTMEIISRPKAILLHFKRFIVTQRDNGEMVLRKNKAKIPLKDSLSISSFFSAEEEKPNGLYHLCGVVHHVGNTAFSGHYTTCAKRNLEEESVEEQWVFFDDTVGRRRTINYVTGNETNQKNCYMALYELK